MSPDPLPPVSDQTPTPERRWTCEKPGWMGACSPSSTHHNGFDWGCGWIYPAAPPAPTPEPEPAPLPDTGDGRPLPEFTMVACAEHLLAGHRWRCRTCRAEVERQFRECCEEMWRLQRSTPAPSPSQPEPGTLDELRNLRRWKSEATIVLDTWDKVHEALGSPGLPGEHKSSASLAHRVALGFRQALSDEMQVDHLCRNRICVRPDHLEEVTQQENIRRALPFRVTR